MCDIWKGNSNSKQLTETDISKLLESLKMLDTKRIVMSGGEALLNKNFFEFCNLIRKNSIKITLLSTGLTIEQHADKIADLVDDVIISLDGDEALHNQIRNIPNAFQKLKNGIRKIRSINNSYPVSARCVVHNLNFRKWDKIILAAKDIGVNSISFLPADVSSQAFNRDEPWEKDKQDNILINKQDLSDLQNVIHGLLKNFHTDFSSGFIVESQTKIQKIYQYYAAQQGLTSYPFKHCNAPWVSTVIEADGTVRPCFFHDEIGNIKNDNIIQILNKPSSFEYRKTLDTQTNETCIKCVCYLNLTPRNKSY